MEHQQIGNARDEIELIDLIRVLVKRWQLIVLTTFVITLAGVAISLILPQKFDVTTMIQIGQIVSVSGSQGAPTVIEAPTSLKLKIEDVYLPLAKKKMVLLAGNEPISGATLVVKVLKNSKLLVLSSKATVAGREHVVQLHNLVVDQIVADHKGNIEGFTLQNEALLAQENLQLDTLTNPLSLSLIKQRGQTVIDTAQAELLTLNETRLVLQQNYQNLEKRKELLASQVAQLKESLQRSLANRMTAAQGVSSEPSAMTLMLLDDQIEKDRTRLVAMQDRLLFQFQEDAEKLVGQLAGNLRKITLQKNRVSESQDNLTQEFLNATHAQKVQEQKIVNLMGKIAQLKNTEPLAVGLFSEQPVSPKKPLIIALGFMLGLMGAVLLAFILEYVQQHKQEFD